MLPAGRCCIAGRAGRIISWCGVFVSIGSLTGRRGTGRGISGSLDLRVSRVVGGRVCRSSGRSGIHVFTETKLFG